MRTRTPVAASTGCSAAPGRLGELALAAGEGRILLLTGVQRLERREGARTVRRDELVDPHRPVEVLQPLGSEVAHGDLRELVLGVLEQGMRRLREQDLPAVPGRADARRAMDGQAEVAVRVERCLAGVNAHPYSHVDPVGPRVLRERLARGHGGRHGIAGAPEDRVGPVPLGLHLLAARLLHRFPEDAPVIGQDGAVPVAKTPKQRGRPLDVGEEEGDGAARELCHRAP